MYGWSDSAVHINIFINIWIIDFCLQEIWPFEWIREVSIKFEFEDGILNKCGKQAVSNKLFSHSFIKQEPPPTLICRYPSLLKLKEDKKMSGPIERAFQRGRELKIERNRLLVSNLSESQPTTIVPNVETEEQTNHETRQANAEIKLHSQSAMKVVTRASTAALNSRLNRKMRNTNSQFHHCSKFTALCIVPVPYYSRLMIHH